MREKIIEVIRCVLNNLPWGEITLHTAEDIADRLIANGFGFLDDRPRFLLVRSQASVENLQQILDGGPVILDVGEASIVPIYPNQWISVTERLPEEDGKYLVFEQSSGRTNTSILRYAKDARKVDRYDFKGRWKNAWYEYDSEWGHYTVDSVTHWMPLPQPPKGE